MNWAATSRDMTTRAEVGWRDATAKMETIVRVYTVHAPEQGSQDKGGDLGAYAERFVFVPERFSLLAMLFALPWLLVHRLWLATLGYILLIIGLSAAGAAIGLDQQTIGLLSLAVSVLLGFEAQNLRRWSLERSGYRLVAVVSAQSLQDAEHKFFSHWLEDRSARDGPTPAAGESVAAATP